MLHCAHPERGLKPATTYSTATPLLQSPKIWNNGGHMIKRKLFAFTLAVFLMLALAMSAFAGMQSQATTGTIEGTVTDQTGAVLPNANVKVKNVETAAVRSVLTDDRGFFRAPLLPVGRYDISAELPGFGTF